MDAPIFKNTGIPVILDIMSVQGPYRGQASGLGRGTAAASSTVARQPVIPQAEVSAASSAQPAPMVVDAGPSKKRRCEDAPDDPR